LHSPADTPALPSFPTRRSSDLQVALLPENGQVPRGNQLELVRPCVHRRTPVGRRQRPRMAGTQTVFTEGVHVVPVNRERVPAHHAEVWSAGPYPRLQTVVHRIAPRASDQAILVPALLDRTPRG